MDKRNLESVSSTLDTILTMKTSEDYSSDFDTSTGLKADYTEEATENVKSYVNDNGMYSDDFEESVPSRPTSSVRFSEDLEYIVTSPSPAIGYSYSEDFESEDDGPSNRLSNKRESEIYSEDFESESARTRISYARDQSDSMDSSTGQFQYAESFESITESTESSSSPDNSSRESIQSILLSPRKRRDSDDKEKVFTYTRPRSTNFDSDSEPYTYSDKTTVSEETEITEAALLAKEAFIQQKLDLVKKDATKLQKIKTKPKHIKHERQSKEERDILQHFCQGKIDILKSPGKQNAGKGNTVGECQRYKDLKEARTGLGPATKVAKFGIPDHTVNNIKLENTLFRVNKMATMEIHEPKSCRHCIKKYEKLAEKEFVTNKYAIASEKTIVDKLERENIRCNHPTILMGEILKDLPRLSDNPKEIYTKLMKPLSEKSLMTPLSDSPEVDTTVDEEFWTNYFSRLKGCAWFPNK